MTVWCGVSVPGPFNQRTQTRFSVPGFYRQFRLEHADVCVCAPCSCPYPLLRCHFCGRFTGRYSRALFMHTSYFLFPLSSWPCYSFTMLLPALALLGPAVLVHAENLCLKHFSLPLMAINCTNSNFPPPTQPIFYIPCCVLRP